MAEDAQDMHKTEDPPKTAWMITFADLISLMLTFFVLLFSMSSVKVDKWNVMVNTLTQSLNPGKLTTVAADTSKFNIGTIFRRQATNLDYLAGVLKSGLADDPILANSRVMLLDDRLVIAMPGDLLFSPGKAVLSKKARSALFVLGSLLRNIGNQIAVNGHTDPVPPDPKKGFSSNWELSLVRASAVANALRRSGYTDDIIAYGYADSRFKQLPKLPKAQRYKLGRRVDIVIFPTVGGG